MKLAVHVETVNCNIMSKLKLFYFLSTFATKSNKNMSVSFTMSVCLSTYNNLRTAEQIFMKFYIGEFY
jgi:hypothetical protein